jgi:hypothetical protein
MNAPLVVQIPTGVHRNTAVPSRHVLRNGHHASLAKGFPEDARKRKVQIRRSKYETPKLHQTIQTMDKHSFTPAELHGNAMVLYGESAALR